MASVLLILENLGEDKHVESVWLPRLDEGSTPSSSIERRENDLASGAEEGRDKLRKAAVRSKYP